MAIATGRRRITPFEATDSPRAAVVQETFAPRPGTHRNIDPSPFSRAEAQSAARREEIARLAYYRAERRGFAPGHELEDWVEAEREVYARHAML